MLEIRNLGVAFYKTGMVMVPNKARLSLVEIILVLNDNGMSIAKPQGAMSAYFDRVRVSPTYTGCPATLAIEQSIRAALEHDKSDTRREAVHTSQRRARVSRRRSKSAIPTPERELVSRAELSPRLDRIDAGLETVQSAKILNDISVQKRGDNAFGIKLADHRFAR